MTLAELINLIERRGITKEDFEKINLVMEDKSSNLIAVTNISLSNKKDDITIYLK